MRFLLCILIIVLCCVESGAQQIARSMTSSAGLFVGFYEFKPPTYNSDPNKKFPLIIFLHGVGERGNGTTELNRVTANGIPRNIYYGSTMTFTINGITESFLVLSPQLSASYSGWVNGYVDAMLEYAKANLRYDPDRVYLTGLSAGGGGTWDYVSSKAGNANIFAAIAPVCGSSYTAYGMCYIAQSHLPVWAFHAMDDGVVPVGLTQDALKLINTCTPAPNPAPKVTYYPSGGHGIWGTCYDESHAYHNPNLYEWFLSKRKSTNGADQNQAPVVQLSSDVSLVLPNNSARLDGSKSYDFDGTLTSYNWTKISGPSSYTMASQSSAATAVSNLTQGVYVFQLKVTDNKGASMTGQIKVLVQTAYEADKPPVAKAGNDFASSNSTVYLSGAGSFDPDGTISSYKWTQISGPSTATVVGGTTTFPTISQLVSGVYKFRLLVTDNLGKSADDTVAFTISNGTVVNNPPVAKISGTTSITLPVNSTTLDGSGSTDGDGKISKYAWSEVAGPNTAKISSDTAKATNITGLIAGTYNFQLKVTDNLGATASSSVSVTVKSSTLNNKPPVANAGSDFTTPYKDYAYLSAGASYDPDGSIVKYFWTQISGPNTAALTGNSTMFATVANMIAGTYVFRLTVTDNLGLAASDDVNVRLGSVGKPPVANAGNDFTTTADYAYLSAGASYDPDGMITAYSWLQVSGPNIAALISGTTMFPTIRNLLAGSYTFRLKVTDNSGATATDDIIVTVRSKIAASASMLPESVLIDDALPEGKSQLYPNPAQANITLAFNNSYAGAYKIVIYDATGRQALEENYLKPNGAVKQPVNISKLSQGLHYVKIVCGNQQPVVQKFIKL